MRPRKAAADLSVPVGAIITIELILTTVYFNNLQDQKRDKLNPIVKPPGNAAPGAAATGGVKKKSKSKGYKQELTLQQRNEVEEAFNLFDTNGHGLIEVSDLKVALRALGFEPAREEIKKLVSDLNKTQQSRDREKEKEKEGQVTIDFAAFLDIMTTKMSERDDDAQLDKAFILFS